MPWYPDPFRSDMQRALARAAEDQRLPREPGDERVEQQERDHDRDDAEQPVITYAKETI